MNQDRFMIDGVAADKETLRKLTVGLDRLSAFYGKYYYSTFIPEGGSKIKFLTGSHGSGKSHFMALTSYDAEEAGLYPVLIDGKKILLSDFREIYRCVKNSIDIPQLVKKLAEDIAAELGYQWKADGRKTFIDYLSDKGELDGLVRGEIRSLLRKKFTLNPYLDYNFASCFSQLTGCELGMADYDDAARADLYDYLDGRKDQKLTTLRNYGLLGYRIDKYNARNMLRSLSEVIHMAGYGGLFIAVDNLDVIMSKSSLNPYHYTKNRRDDTYESIRALIDDIDNFRYVFFLFAFESGLLNETTGVKSYQALYLRMQNEIVSNRLNWFSDMIDLDKVNKEIYTPEEIVRLSESFAYIANNMSPGVKILDEKAAAEILKKAKYATTSIPALVEASTLKGASEEKEESNA